MGLSASTALALALQLPLHAHVRGTDVASVEVAGKRVEWQALSRTKLDPGPVTLHAAFDGSAAGVEVPHCGRRGAVTIDGTRYAPAPGPFVVRLLPRKEPHVVDVELTISEYERRVTCGEPIHTGVLSESRDGLQLLTFPSPESARGGGHAVLYVPPGHDTTKPAALLVGVHPWNGDEWTYAAYDELLSAARASDVLLLMPNGLGNSLYARAPEQEVMRALDVAERTVAVDPQRVSIWGASMGGQGATTIGLHHPDRFAFITSYFGDARFDLGTYVRSILHTPAEAHTVNPIDVIDNARNVPVWLIHGDADRTSNVRESDELASALRQRGYSFGYDRVPGRGHEGLLVVEHVADVVARAARERAPLHPSRVTFRSVRPEDDRAYGIRVVRVTPDRDAFVDLELSSGRVLVHAAEGVRAVVLSPGALGAPRDAPVSWDKRAPGVEVRWE